VLLVAFWGATPAGGDGGFFYFEIEGEAADLAQTRQEVLLAIDSAYLAIPYCREPSTQESPERPTRITAEDKVGRVIEWYLRLRHQQRTASHETSPNLASPDPFSA
jgi:hypothetical protein